MKIFAILYMTMLFILVFLVSCNETQISITNNPKKTVSANQAPIITAITSQKTSINTATTPILFTVSDVETAADSLILTASSSNTNLIPNSNLILGGTGTNRTITITPSNGKTGQSTITITVSDGTITSSTSFLINVTIAFSGIDEITVYDDHSATLTWTHSAGAVFYDIYRTHPDYARLTTISAPAVTYTMTGLTANTTYSYKVVAIDSQGNPAGEDVIRSVTTDSAPQAPVGITLGIPNSSPNVHPYPGLTVSGVEAGDIIKIYSDNCITEVGSVVASGTSAFIYSTVALIDGQSMTFKADSTNVEGGRSACTLASATYTRNGTLSCPPNFLLVPGNRVVGEANNFCVAKYHMKCPGDATGTACAGTPVSQASNRPWVNINQATARTKCEGIGAGYTLIKNTHWMTIARNLENVNSNWTGGSSWFGKPFYWTFR